MKYIKEHIHFVETYEQVKDFDFDDEDFDFEEEQPITYKKDRFIMYRYGSAKRLCYLCERDYSKPTPNFQIWDVDNREKNLMCYTTYKYITDNEFASQDDIDKYLSIDKLNRLLENQYNNEYIPPAQGNSSP